MDKEAVNTLKTRMAYHYLFKRKKINIYNDYLKGIISKEQLYKQIPQSLLDTCMCETISKESLKRIYGNIDSALQGKEVDVIIGGHPHVVEPIELFTSQTDPEHKTVCLYSLGNAVSNMSAENTQIELMATVRLIRETNGDIIVLPIEFTWLWCSRPGGYCDSYSVLPVEEFIDRKHEWKGEWDYEKMMKTYRLVRKTTGINNR